MTCLRPHSKLKLVAECSGCKYWAASSGLQGLLKGELGGSYGLEGTLILGFEGQHTPFQFLLLGNALKNK